MDLLHSFAVYLLPHLQHSNTSSSTFPLVVGCLCLFVRLFVGSSVRWFVGSLVRRFVGLVGSFVRWLVCLFVCLFVAVTDINCLLMRSHSQPW